MVPLLYYMMLKINNLIQEQISCNFKILEEK
nr:MAG TPA: Nuclear receptor-interacting protein 1 repression 4 [Caudoviricetes sp.]